LHGNSFHPDLEKIRTAANDFGVELDNILSSLTGTKRSNDLNPERCLRRGSRGRTESRRNF